MAVTLCRSVVCGLGELALSAFRKKEGKNIEYLNYKRVIVRK